MKYLPAKALAVAALVFSLTSPVAISAAPKPQPTPKAVPEPHPEIRDAIASLRRARMHLDHAAHDFGGHRVDAIRATDEAIRQLQLCLAFDK